jgi:cytochrome c-type biogenesis protein CcmH/NrfF
MTTPNDPLTQHPDEPRYEPPPSVGKLLLWVLLFVLAALVVVVGGVYLS